MFIELLRRFFVMAAFFLASTETAYAYLDPVTGSLLVQGLIALIAGVVAGVKSIRKKLIGLVSSVFRRKDEK